MLRLAILVSHPIQYFASLYREIAHQPGIDLTVYYESRLGIDEMLDKGFNQVFKWDIPLLDGYKSQFLPSVLSGNGGFWRPFSPIISKELIQKRFDILWVHGHYSGTHWMGMAAAKLVGTRVLLRSESNIKSMPAYEIGGVLKSRVLRAIFSLVNGFMYIGGGNREYYKYFGVKDDRLFFTPYVVDNYFFQKTAKELLPKRSEIRSAWGILDDRPIILFVGKLVSKKQPLLLLEAYRQVRNHHPCALMIAGDGELRVQIEKIVQDQSIPDVIITGFLNQTEIARAYVSGDIFVLPSTWRETWGLVVNEAMNFELPIIVSDRVGCGDDLVHPDKNGYIFQAESITSLVECLSRLVHNAENRHRFGLESLKIIDTWGIKECAQGIIRASYMVSGLRGE